MDECYYARLELSRGASVDEVKKAFRRLALKWHPDKNIEVKESSTHRFHMLQEAHDALTDPPKKGWYDNNWEKIFLAENLRGKKSTVLQKYSLNNSFSGYEDDERGFYTVFNNVFTKIEKDELHDLDENFKDLHLQAPKFGAPVYKKGYITFGDVIQVLDFYVFWEEFECHRTFAKNDVMNPNNVPKEFRKLLIRINEKARKKARLAFAEEVKSLVSWIRERDPRLIKLCECLPEQISKLESCASDMINEMNKHVDQSMDQESPTVKLYVRMELKPKKQRFKKFKEFAAKAIDDAKSFPNTSSIRLKEILCYEA